MQRLLILVLTTFLLTLASVASVQAQDNANEGIAEVVKITPAAGKGPELEKAIAKYHRWMADKDGHFEYNWYMIDTGPETGKYIARSGNHNWADFDVKHDWDDEADAKFAETIAPLVEHVERSFTRNMDEVSHWPESFDGYTHFMVEDWYVRNGSYGDFMKALGTIHDAMTKSNFAGHWGFLSVATGGHGNQVSLVIPNKGWSGMTEKDPSFSKILTEALGGEEQFATFMSDFGNTFKVGGNRMVRYLPEASSYGN
jgi:hypothetical protein